MEVIIEFDTVQTLAVVNTQTQHAVIARAFETATHQIPESITNMRGRPVEHQTHIAFVTGCDVDGIGTIHRYTVLAGLEYFKAVRNLGDTGADAVFLFIIERNIGIEISKLSLSTLQISCVWAGIEFRLNVDV